MTANEIEDFDELLVCAEDAAHTDWEMDFTRSMRMRYKKWGAQMFISVAQLEQLKKLAGT